MRYEFEQAEKLAVEANQPTPPFPPGYRKAFQAKIDAIHRRDFARWNFQAAGGRVDGSGRPVDPAPGAASMVGLAGAGGGR